MKDVALVLSSGGARGFAYIGAIEELERRGYRITSVAGCSVGSLIGGVYAAGGLSAFRDWLFSLGDLGVLSLLDLRISKRFLVKGGRLMAAIEKVVPDVDIRDLKIPFTAVATDLYTGEEVIFREGKLFDAIRASISIPTLFSPVKYGHRTLVDGGLVNTMPLNRVARSGKDLLVGFDVNDIDAEGINAYLSEMYGLDRGKTDYWQDSLTYAGEMRQRKDISLLDKIREVGGRGVDLLRQQRDTSAREKSLLTEGEKQHLPISADDNYYSILSRSFSITNHVIANRMIEAVPPDILVRMPLDAVQGTMAYAHGREISEMGRSLMAEALDRYESGQRDLPPGPPPLLNELNR